MLGCPTIFQGVTHGFIPTGTRVLLLRATVLKSAISSDTYNYGSLDNIGLALDYFDSPFNRNIVINGDFEQGPTPSPYGTIAAYVPNWLVVRGVTTALDYSPPGSNLGLTSTSPGPSDRGQRYVYGGNGTALLRQVICFPSFSPYIVNQTLLFNFSGWLGGYGTEGDGSGLTIVFIDEKTGYGIFPLHGGVEYMPGPMPKDRNNQTLLMFYSVAGTVPLGAHCIVLTASASQPTGQYNDGLEFSI
ncbi:unnamed protein product [Didymodactylos carnosus]|uniref:Uncharacterized protein n=1 Tax=Didymodactylos carnosus TaxID=1234261 RepID=A0A8S2HYJ9_9BILA|nr:unnamed protein product [Didymodactylos carnosus]CAF3696689.1 unnamed protein product [Didymodactylos carnosus]